MIRKRSLLALLLGAVFALAAAAPAEADFGLHDVEVIFTGKNGEILDEAGPLQGTRLPQGELLSQAGEHPFAVTVAFRVNGGETAKGGEVPDEAVRNALFSLMPGFAAAPTAVPSCSTADFLIRNGEEGQDSNCPASAAVGVVANQLASESSKANSYSAVYNLEPSPGAAAKLGFWASGVPVTIDGYLSEEPPYQVVSGPTNIPQPVEVMGSVFTLWGVPADPAHDPLRGRCLGPLGKSTGDCEVRVARVPFITMPRNCDGPLATSYEALSWPGSTDAGFTLTHDESGNPQGMTGCGSLAFNPQITAQPTARATTSPTGLDFSLDVNDEGLVSPDGIAGADVRRVEVELPEGMSVNPSQAEGLGVCTEGQLGGERSFSAPGEGCPESAKIGSLELETPLLKDRLIRGSIYVAEPYRNRFGSLLALYIVVKDRDLGISVVQPAEVIADPETGRLTTVARDIPELPFSSFRFHFKEGARSPLVTPPSCDADPAAAGNQPFTVEARLYPSSGGPAITSTDSFQLVSGPDNSPCPAGGLPPLHPHLVAGTVSNAAGRFSPFNLRISRTDAEQEITHFSIKLPPGVVGKLAGVATCPDAAIAAAQARTGPLGGHEELASPSCPADSYVGRTLVGAGVGSALAYAPGNVYLAGPYHGAPLSIVAITAGVVGPFDIGTVVVREALRIDPETAEVFIDATDSDPIPHIVKGIPVHLRDIRVYTDRPEFVLNPTDCTRTSTASTVLGAGLDFASPADDNPFVATSPFQAADCAALPFKPKLGFRLKGATHRGAHPALSARVAMNGIGEAAIRYARVTLPHSEFLEQGHIGTICTRVQFKSGSVPGENCPPASVYGHVKAVTPILDGALEGPIFLRSSEHPLPDLVAALHHAEINVALVGRIDSINGQIRNTFDFVPDAPVTSAVFTFGAGKKSLLVNSTNICKGKHRVKVELKGHNGKVSNYRTPLRATCHRRHRK